MGATEMALLVFDDFRPGLGNAGVGGNAGALGHSLGHVLRTLELDPLVGTPTAGWNRWM